MQAAFLLVQVEYDHFILTVHIRLLGLLGVLGPMRLLSLISFLRFLCLMSRALFLRLIPWNLDKN